MYFNQTAVLYSEEILANNIFFNLSVNDNVDFEINLGSIKM